MSLAVRIFTSLNFLSLAALSVNGFLQGSWGALFGLILFVPGLCAATALWAAFTNSRRAFLAASWTQLLMGLIVSAPGFPAGLLLCVAPCVSLYSFQCGQEIKNAIWGLGKFLLVRRWPIAGLLAAVICAASWQYTDGFTRIWDNAAVLSANPSRLSGATVRDANLSSLRLENVTISKAVFNNVDFYKAMLVNVTFDSCIFINCKMNGVQTKNVTFRGGRLGSKSSSERPGYGHDTLRSKNLAPTLLFDGVLFGPYLSIDADEGGTFIFRDCRRDGEGEHHSFFLTGKDLSVRLDNCNLPRIRVQLEGKSRLYATQSVLRDAYIYNEGGIFYMEGGTVSARFVQGTGVIRNATVQADIWGSVDLRLAGNTYRTEGLSSPPDAAQSPLRLYGDSMLRIAGKDKEKIPLKMRSGICIAENVTLEEPVVGPENSYPIGAVHLHDAVVRGGLWHGSYLRRSSFDAVTLYPTLKVEPGSPLIPAGEQKRLQAVDLRLPQGNPWGEHTPDIDAHTTPWVPVRIPEPEEMGMGDLAAMR